MTAYPATRVPDDLHDRYAAWKWEKVYEWIPGRPTFRLSTFPLTPAEVRYLKIQPVGTGIPDEATRLRWAADYVRVPRLIEYGSDGFKDWLMTAELSGVGAADHPLRTTDPVRLVTIFAQGLRAFHDAFDVDDCPFDFRLPTALRAAQARAAQSGGARSGAVGDDSRVLLGRARKLAAEITGAPELGSDFDDWASGGWDSDADLVVCHGDYCMPNAFIEDDAAVTGYIDLGGLAVADRWYDLSIALRSLEQPYNLGPGYADVFLDAYGVTMDAAKNELYPILYDLTS